MDIVFKNYIEAMAQLVEDDAAYCRLNDLFKKFQSGFNEWNFEEMEKSIPVWYDICREMTIYKNRDDLEIDDLFKEFKNRIINRQQLKEKMRNQIKQAEDELKERAQKRKESKKKASRAYDEIVKSANNTDKYLAFCLKQPATRKFMLGEDIEVLV